MAIPASAVAALIDHTILKPEATSEDVRRLCAEANDLGVAAVCISPSRLPLEPGWLRPGIGVAVVCGFPSGAHASAVKATEARLAVEAGATEIDMVIDLGAAKEGRWDAVTADVAAVRDACAVPVKAILETAVLTDDEIVAACRAAEAGGAAFVKTSTGFHPSGGATIETVRLMAQTVGGRLGVKASGGIRTAAEAVAMIEAGATRLGTSRSREIVAGLAP